MENSNIIEIIAIIITFFGSAGLIFFQLLKNRKLETVRYLSMIRKEIWDIAEFKKIKDISDADETDKIRAIKQKLEYLAAAVNHCVFNRRLVRLFCGRWFKKAVEDLDILNNQKGKQSKKGEYDEIEILYNKFDKYYKKLDK